MQILEAEGFQQWKDHPLTQEFLAVLKRRRDNLMEAWARGQALCPEHQSQAVLLGRLSEVHLDDLREMVGLDPQVEG